MLSCIPSPRPNYTHAPCRETNGDTRSVSVAFQSWHEQIRTAHTRNSPQAREPRQHPKQGSTMYVFLPLAASCSCGECKRSLLTGCDSMGRSARRLHAGLRRLALHVRSSAIPIAPGGPTCKLPGPPLICSGALGKKSRGRT